MKKRILCLILAVIMLVGMCAVFASCGECEHVDENNDRKCDFCDESVTGLHKHKDENEDGKCDGCQRVMNNNEEEEVISYPWADSEPVTLIFQMTHNSNSKELPSGCGRYLAGGADINNASDLAEYGPKDQAIDAMVLERNTKALESTNVAVRYQYWDDVGNYGHKQTIELMYSNAVSGAVGTVPDMYCNFTHDIVAASIKGAFSNLRSTLHNYGGANFFSFLDEDYDELVDNKGYMYDYMCSTTLNPDKMYVLASDYFTDLIRAFFIIPVNKALLESVGEDITTDLDGDGEFTIEDFYLEVKDKKWTYTKVAEYSDAIYESGGGSTGATSINDRLGLAISAGGLAASGVLYSTSIVVINKTLGDDGKYVYEYPAESPQLTELFKSIKTLVESPGVYVASSQAELTAHGNKHLTAIRKRFCESKVLFGDIMLIGALEYDEYQKLKGVDGFGVVPVPLYHEVAEDDPENYLTTIHSIGRSGAIAANTAKFAECTAFLNYQSTHSTEILNEYYDFNLQYTVVDGSSKGTVEMLQYIRSNVRSAFDKTFEDALSFRFEDDHAAAGIDKVLWHAFLSSKNYAYGEQIYNSYAELRDMKQGELQTLLREYETTPS